jgi:hypothetical protein
LPLDPTLSDPTGLAGGNGEFFNRLRRAVKRALQEPAGNAFHPPVVPHRGMDKLWEPVATGCVKNAIEGGHALPRCRSGDEEAVGRGDRSLAATVGPSVRRVLAWAGCDAFVLIGATNPCACRHHGGPDAPASASPRRSVSTNWLDTRCGARLCITCDRHSSQRDSEPRRLQSPIGLTRSPP